ncbi:MAG: SurA N-terminal domain-containing protein [Pseudomonadota bacterium]|nr:SurA N-terminal domain-containing protein [Pseudomonadota bacterium]
MIPSTPPKEQRVPKGVLFERSRVMLQNLRERFTGRFALVILALICLPFLFFGVPNDFIRTEEVASVNGNPISQPFFENAYRNQLLRYDSEGIEVPEEARTFVRENVLNTIINDILIELFIIEEGVHVSDEFVAQIIQSAPEFILDGKFSKELYYTWLNERVIEPSIFEENQRLNIRKSQLERAIRATSFVTPSEYRRYLNLIGEQRQVTIAEIDLSVLAEPIELKDKDIEEYYTLRSEEFMEPESIDFDFLEINRNNSNERIEVSEDELRLYYQDSGQRFAQDERRQASHILVLFGDDEVASEAKAKEVVKRLQQGEEYTELVLEYSDDEGTKQQGGDLGMLAKSQLPGALGDAIFTMQLGEISNLVRTEFGFHIVKLVDMESNGMIPFDLVRNEIESELRLQKVSDNFILIERALSDALFDAEDINVLADDLGFSIKRAENYTQLGGEPFGTNQIVIDAIFNAQRNNDREISDIIEVDADRSIVFQIHNYNQSKVKSLDEVYDEITNDMKFAAAEVLASNIATRLETLMRDNQSIEEAVTELSSVSMRNVTINRVTEDIDFMIQASVFGAKKPENGKPRVGTVIMQNSNYAVYSINNNAYGIPEMIPQEERDEARERLNQQAGMSDYAAFVAELNRLADITKNQELITSSSMYD